MTLKQAALEYAKIGFRVIPLITKGKVPRIKNWQNDASSDLSTVELWWDKWPNANIGILMDKIFVVDIDPRNGGDFEVFQDMVGTDLSNTLICSTGGNGVHLYFGGSFDKSKLSNGVDLQGKGSFVVAPPSVHPNGNSYQWEDETVSISDPPEKLIELIATKQPTKTQSFEKDDLWQEKFKIKEKVPNGEKHMELFRMACSLRAQGFDYDFIVEPVIEACRNNCEDGESVPRKNIEKIVKDVCDRYEKGTDYQKETEDFKDSGSEVKAVPINFPLDSLGDVLGPACLAISKKVGAPKEIAASSLLAAAALCVQEFYDLEAFGGIRPLSLYFLTIAESGERKSTVDSIVLKEHNEWLKEQSKAYEKKRAIYKADLDDWKRNQKKGGRKPTKPKAPILFVTDPTVEGLFFVLKDHRESVGLFSDEGGAFLGGYAMKQENSKSTLAKLNKLWDGSRLDRIRRGGNIEDADIDILYNRRLSCHLMMQPKVASDLFNNEYAKDQGFLARCLISHPKSKIGKREFTYAIKEIPEVNGFYEKVRALLERSEKAQKEKPKRVVIEMSSEALEIAQSFYAEIEPNQAHDKKYAGVRGFASKAVEQAIRIAAVIECFEQRNAKQIDETTMRRGVNVARYYLESHVATSQGSAVFESKDHEVIHGIIQRRPKWKFRQLLQMVPKRYKRKQILLPIVQTLSNQGWCQFDPQNNEITN